MKNIEILVVDDTLESLRLLTDLLRSKDYVVRSTTDPALALNSALDAPPDLALLDVTMPGMDGFELCQRLKQDERTASVPVIFVSALYEVEDRLRGFEVGGVDFITKPIEKQIVLARVDTHLRLARMQRELEQTNAELAEARDKAEAANQAKSVFLANMNHELRTPLNSILGFTEVLGWDATPDQMENINIITSSGEHLLAMINDALDLAKIEAGRMELQPEEFDLQLVLKDLGQLFEMRAESAELSFRLELDPDITPNIKADLNKLRQVLINLLGNAVKFTPEGSVVLRARTQPIPAESDLVNLLLEVEDSGVGIAEQELPHIFKPFQQAGRSPSATKGTGLGLAITKSLVEFMAGSISVESTEGQGTCFRVEIPVARVDSAETDLSSSLRTNIVGLEPGQPDWRVLVVDDDPNSLRLVSRLLRQVGFQVQEAVHGEQAVDLFERWHPHFIWMDMRMPVMDGYEATRRIRTSPGGDEVKIVALTASAFKGQHKRITDAGCDEVQHKPFRSHEIYETIGRQLGVRYCYSETKGLAKI